MVRPCFIVADREHAGSISTRKLVIETAKLNVVTVYSGVEAIETLKKFPKVDGVVVDTGIEDMPVDDLVASLKGIQPTVPIIAINRPSFTGSRLADYELESFEPARLLELLKKLEPERTQAIEKEDERLAAEE